MSSEDRIPVRFSAADAATEITLRDSCFRQVASGVGALETAIPPGLYAVRYSAGDGLLEDLVEVPAVLPKGHQRIEFPSPGPVSFTSAAVATTPLQHEQLEMAAAWSREWASAGPGTGSGIFIFVSDGSAAGDSPGGDAKAWAGLSLRGANGVLLGDVAEKEGCFGLNLKVDPGSYILRSGEGAGGVEMPVFACAHWQTQVFLEMRTTRGSREKSANLEDAAIFMAHPGQGFDPEAEATRLSEIALKGLESGRLLARPGSAFKQELLPILDEKFAHPLLGIYGLHLLLAENERDSALIEIVCRNLANLGLAGHPDFRALCLEAGVEIAGISDEFPEPPMLLASWRLLLEASAKNSRSITRDSLSARIASRIVGSGPWLIWRALDVAKKEAPSAKGHTKKSPRVSPFLVELEGIRGDDGRSSTPKEEGLRGDWEFGGVEKGLEKLPGTRSGPISLSGNSLGGDFFSDDFLPAELVRAASVDAEDFLESKKPAAELSYLEKTVKQALLAQKPDSPPDIPSLVRSLGLPATTIEDTLEALGKKER